MHMTLTVNMMNTKKYIVTLWEIRHTKIQDIWLVAPK